ncbi:MAG: hypothetical protein LBD03_01080 [Methanobrevibacter sp.]|nr:hypothetical protein [Candidatus Methanovirga procula]
MSNLRVFIGLFVIFLVTSLNFVPALNNNSSAGLNDTNTNSTVVTPLNTNNSTGVNNTTAINKQYIVFGVDYKDFNYLDYVTPINTMGRYNKRSVWHDELTLHLHEYYNATYAYINWTDEVVRLADESYENGTNTYDSGSGGRFHHVPIPVMKKVYISNFVSFNNIFEKY